MKNKFILFPALLIILVSTSCNKWLDVNTDPNVANDIRIDLMLPSIEYDIATDLALGSSNIGYVASVYTHQVTTREEYDQYGINSSSFANYVYWDDLFSGPLKECDIIIEKGTASDNLKYAGIAKILKAYVYSQLVDIWGDVPFAEFNNPDNFSPKFDDDASIYPQLFSMIDEGIADINNETSLNKLFPGGDDIIYGGDIPKWTRFANTLKLKLYVQVQKTNLWDVAKVQTLLSEGNLIAPNEDFMFPFGPSSSPENRHPGFSNEYGGSQIGVYISPWFYNLLLGNNPNIFHKIKDPRIAYYFCNQLKQENPAEYRNKDTCYLVGVPQVTKNKIVRKFRSIYFGSNGTNRDMSGRSTFTMLGIYPCGGHFDDNKGGTDGMLSSDDGTGAAPMRLLTYADRLYLEAELYNRGFVSGDARAKLVDAINESFKLVDKVVDMTGTTQLIKVYRSDNTNFDLLPIPTLYGSSEVEAYKDSVLALYDNVTDNEKRLEIIMTQKWIQRFAGNSVDSYSDYRRTGYPILFRPGIDPSTGGNDIIPAVIVPCSSSRNYVVSWPWPQSELDVNTNAPVQKNQTTDKVFWDID